MEKTRNFFIDIIKGLAIFLMIWGHCIQYCCVNTEIDFFNNYVFKFIYSFHMPLFMLVSGYLFFYSFSKRDLKQLLIYKTQSLLQPILFGSIFIFLITTVPLNLLNGNIKILFNGGGWIEKIPSLWFLWSVLSSAVVTSIVCKTTKKLHIQIPLFLIMSVVVAFFPNRDLNLYMYPYFVLGFYFAKYKNSFSKIIHNTKYLCLALFPILLFFYEKKHYIYTTGIFSSSYSLYQMIKIDLFRWLIGLVGSIFIITILEIIYKKITQKVKKPMISITLSRVGEKSIQFYVISVPILSVYLPFMLSKVLSVLNIENIFAKNTLIYNFVFTFILAIISTVFLFFIIKIFEKLKINKIIFGK